MPTHDEWCPFLFHSPFHPRVANPVVRSDSIVIDHGSVLSPTPTNGPAKRADDYNCTTDADGFVADERCCCEVRKVNGY